MHELRQGDIRSYSVQPANLGGFRRAARRRRGGKRSDLQCAGARRAFQPPVAALRDLIAVNAATALYCAGALATQRARYLDAVAT